MDGEPSEWDEPTARRIAWLDGLNPAFVVIPARPWARVVDAWLYLESLRRDARHGPHGPRALPFRLELERLHSAIAARTRRRTALAAAETIEELDGHGAEIKRAAEAGEIKPEELAELRQAWVDRRQALDAVHVMPPPQVAGG